MNRRLAVVLIDSILICSPLGWQTERRRVYTNDNVSPLIGSPTLNLISLSQGAPICILQESPCSP